MDEPALNMQWRHLVDGLRLAADSPAYQQIPALAERVRLDVDWFSNLSPVKTPLELTERGHKAFRLMAIWDSQFILAWMHPAGS